MSQPPIERGLSTRRCNQMPTDHSFWTTDLSFANKNHNKLTCSSSSTTDDQKGDSFSSSDSDASLKKDPVLDDTITVLDINEPLMIINKEQGNNMQQSTSDEDVLKCDNHSQVKDLVPLPLQLAEPESNKLISQALELTQSLFGPDTTIVKTFQANPIQYELDIDDDTAQITRMEDKRWGEESEETDERKKGGSLDHDMDGDDSFKNRIISPAINTQTLLNHSDFTALEILNAIYCNSPVSGSRFVKPTSTAFSYMLPNAKSRTQLKTKTSITVSTESEQSTRERDEEILHQRRCELMDEYFHRPGNLHHIKTSFHRQGQVWSDQRYHEYYEYLCKAGIKRALSHPGSFDLDCGAGSLHTPYSQQTNGICRAMKSNLYYQYSPGPEIYSRKVFVGGLPIDIDEDELTATFNRFGPLVVDWPNKGENKSYFPPKGYVFLIFDYEVSVRALVHSCFVEDEKLFLYISSPLSPDKLVQIRPWRLADADYVVEASIPLYARRAIFVGGVPRPIKAVELAHIMDRLYGSVGCAGIDTDVEYKYPKGAGRIAFTNQNSYMKAITDRYVQLSHDEVEKRVELKPYVLDDQPCDECGGERCGHRHAPFFCPQLSCLQYYCEKCWTTIHGCRAREDHKPLIKEA
uniref:Cytoplasmic polyadenylation element-binding protein 1 n=1 Tax=Onchocerca volvulus TaxID=6282 RepID=A0A8R1XLK7_ONCVO